MVDTPALGAGSRKGLRVRVSPAAQGLYQLEFGEGETMKPEKIKEHLAKLFTDDYKQALIDISIELGKELPKNDLKILAEFRSMLASVLPEGRYFRNSLSEHGYIRGSLATLLEVAAAYETAVQQQVENKEVAELLRGYGLEPLVVALLQEEAVTVKSLSAYLVTEHTSVVDVRDDEDKAEELYSSEQIEQNLLELCGLEVVECFGDPPEYYRLTLRGESIANILKFENK